MAVTPPAAGLFAIILAGGASSRLHATSPHPVTDKPLLEFEGEPLITRVLSQDGPGSSPGTHRGGRTVLTTDRWYRHGV